MRGSRQRLAVAVGLAWLGACMQPAVTTCPDGRICPEDRVCDVARGRCVLAEQLTSCDGMPGGADCAYPGTPDGVCDDGLCVPKGCGDGTINGLEECEPGDLGGATCLDLGYYNPGGLRCFSDCTFDRSGCEGRCGDGVLDGDGDEDCDGDDLGGASCTDLGFYRADGLACNAICGFDVTGCEGFCGDGIVNGAEDCDGDDLGGADCQSLGFYRPDGLACDPQCRYVVDSCDGECGDGVYEPLEGEICDGPPPEGQTCLDYGFDTGNLECSDFCGPGFGQCRFVGWHPASTPANEVLRAIRGVGSVYAVAAGGVGQVFVRDATGWSSISTGGSEDLWGVWTSGPDDVIVCGANGVVMRWDGASWSTDDTGVTVRISAIWGPSNDDLFAVGGDGTILRYQSGAWNPMTTPSTGTLLTDVWGRAVDDVFAVGTSGVVWHYDGSDWQVATSQPGNRHFWGIHGLSTGEVYVTGSGGVVLEYDGATWSDMSPAPPTTDRQFSIWGSSPSDLYIVGDAGIHHFDGQRWVEQEPRRHTGFIDVWGSGPDEVIAVGGGGNIEIYDGAGSWSPVTSPASDEITGFWAASYQELYVTTVAGEVYRFDGLAWTEFGPGTGEMLRNPWGRSGDDLYVINSSKPGWLWHWNGTDWSELDSGTGVYLWNLWGTADNVYAVGFAIARYGGAGWTVYDKPTGNFLVGIDGTGDSDAYAAGLDGTLVHFDGTGWTQIDPGTTEILSSVYVAGQNDVYVAGFGGTVIHYDGSAWTPMETGHGYAFDSLDGTGPDDLWGTTNQSIYHFDGATWQAFRSGTDAQLHKTWVGPTDIYFGGDGGAFRRFVRPAP